MKTEKFQEGYEAGIKYMQALLARTLDKLGNGPYYSYDTCSDVITNIISISINANAKDEPIPERAVRIPKRSESITELLSELSNQDTRMIIEALLERTQRPFHYRERDVNTLTKNEIAEAGLYIALKNYQQNYDPDQY